MLSGKYLDAAEVAKLAETLTVRRALEELGKQAEELETIYYLYVVDEEDFFDGEHIVEEGKHGSWIWVILEGVVDIVKEMDSGTIPIVRIGDGSFIGSMASFLLQGHIRTATAIAVGNVQLGVLDSQRDPLNGGFQRFQQLVVPPVTIAPALQQVDLQQVQRIDVRISQHDGALQSGIAFQQRAQRQSEEAAANRGAPPRGGNGGGGGGRGMRVVERYEELGDAIVTVTKVILSELACYITLRFEQTSNGWVFLLHAFGSTWQTNFGQTGPHR